MHINRRNVNILFVVESDVCELLPPGPVHRVRKPGVVGVQLRSVG